MMTVGKWRLRGAKGSFLLLWWFVSSSLWLRFFSVVALSSSSSSSSLPSHETTATSSIVTTATESPSSSLSSSGSPSSSSSEDDNHYYDTDSYVHTLLLCRHGDSIWNGGEAGSRETFTGWTNVPLSQKGINEAKETGRQVSEFELGIDACFTSILQRAQLTAHYCLWGFAEKPNALAPRRYYEDYRLNERHYGALQGLVKEDVERGMYGHEAELVQQWRRSWHTAPPVLDDDDPRRLEEIKLYANHCGGAKFVPKGESVEQVAENRIRSFLDQSLCPVLEQASQSRRTTGIMSDDPLLDGPPHGGTGLVVAHANSLRALIGVICNVQQNQGTLKKLEALRLQTGVPLVLKFRRRRQSCRPESVSNESSNSSTTEDRELSDVQHHHEYQPCDLEGIPFLYHLDKTESQSKSGSYKGRRTGLVPELPVYPLNSIPMKERRATSTMTTTGNGNSTVDGEKSAQELFNVKGTRSDAGLGEVTNPYTAAM